MPKKTYIIIGVILIISALTVGSLYYYDDAQTRISSLRLDIKKELAKILLQLVIIGIIGVFIKHLFDQHAKEKERRSSENEFRLELIRRFLKTYREIRKTRIYLETVQSAKMYRDQMKVIIEVRLDLSEILHEIETAGNVFKNVKMLQGKINLMEEHLKKLISEFEYEYNLIANMQKQYEKDYVGLNEKEKERERKTKYEEIRKEINSLTCLSDFRKAPKEGDFHKDYLSNYFEVRDELRLQYWKALGTEIQT